MTLFEAAQAAPIDCRGLRTAWAAVGGVILAIATAGFAQSATFTVTSTADSGAGSLRQAVLDANAAAGADLVVFDIPAGQCSAAGVCTIELESTIVIDEAVTVDATTQPRYGSAPANVCATENQPSHMRVEIIGVTGLRLLRVDATAFTTIRGLSLGGGWGIALNAGSGHRVQCNHLCLNGPGDTGLSGWGVAIEGDASGMIIGVDGDGVDDRAERNVFGDCVYGVYVNTNSLNWIAGNYFGFGSDGVTGIPGSHGVYMRQVSTDNLVGTNEDGVSDDFERNVIGNMSRGIRFDPLSYLQTTNRVIGNWIGLDTAGFPAPNSYGIWVQDAGLAEVIRGNRIEHNSTGIYIVDDATISVASMCNTFVGNTTGLRHDGSGDASLINSWWGSADGPSLDGPGSGDAIELTGIGELVFTPWLTAEDEPCPYLFADGFERGTTSEWDSAIF